MTEYYETMQQAYTQAAIVESNNQSWYVLFTLVILAGFGLVSV